jgi:hypothetical protein
LLTKLPVMQTTSSIGVKGKLFTDIISEQTLICISKYCGFSRRRPKKLSALSMLISYLDFISSSSFSFHNWSVQFCSVTGKTVSKQAIHKRINDTFVQFAESVLSHILQNQFTKYVDKDLKLFKAFGNVYLQDATHFSLPLHLARLFPGNYTHGATRAVAKIVTIFNLKKGCFSVFSLTSFLDPDSSSVGLIYDKLKPGDLMIRDLGYFVMNGFEDLIDKGAYFLSRHKYNVIVRDIKNKNPINLAQYLKKHQYLDMPVLLSSLNPISVRLVACPLPKPVANARRRKARKDKRNDKINHNRDYYYLLGYAIYITNVDESTWSADDMSKAYKCRWTIETLFKSWKSNLKAHYTAPDRYATPITVKTHFYMLLIYVSAFVMPMLIHMEKRISKIRDDVFISILKLTKYIATNLQVINARLSDKLIDTIIYYTKYDSRTDRINAAKFTAK